MNEPGMASYGRETVLERDGVQTRLQIRWR